MRGENPARRVYMSIMLQDLETGQILGALFLVLVIIAMLLQMGGRNLHRSLQNASIWALIFVGAIAAAGLWEDISGDLVPRQASFASEGRVEVPRSFDGHYYLTLEINGNPVNFVVDTGATEIVLRKEDAALVGLDPNTLQYFGRANTANGEVRTALVRLDQVSVGGIGDRNVPAYVNDGDLFQSLLGMSYLSRWDTLQIEDNKLVLIRQ